MQSFDFYFLKQVLDISIQDQLRVRLEKLKPRPSIYCPDFIAANQVSILTSYTCNHIQ